MKKALIITYYWPPSGGGGVQRWLKFVKYLREFDWEPVIYTPENPDFELQDSSLMEDVPSDILIIKRPIWEPYGIYRKLLGKKAVQQQGVVSGESKSLLNRLSIWIRGNYFIPDARVFWVRPSVTYLSRYLKKANIDVVITTGPPHSVHLIGLELKKRLDVKWLADFRDPWSEWDVLDKLKLSNRSFNNHKKLEKKVLESADLVLSTSPSTAKSLSKLGAVSSKMITNGFDDDAIVDTQGWPEKFRIAHIGLLNQGRNPNHLWKVLDKMCKENEKFNDDLEVFLAGTVESEIQESIGQYDYLKNRTKITSYRSHNEVISDYQNSAVLLLLVNNSANARCNIPGKLFEYLGQKKPVLALGEPESDASNILKEVGYNESINYNDEDRLEIVITEFYELYKAKNYTRFAADSSKYSRRRLTQDLANNLNSML